MAATVSLTHCHAMCCFPHWEKLQNPGWNKQCIQIILECNNFSIYLISLPLLMWAALTQMSYVADYYYKCTTYISGLFPWAQPARLNNLNYDISLLDSVRCYEPASVYYTYLADVIINMVKNCGITTKLQSFQWSFPFPFFFLTSL